MALKKFLMAGIVAAVLVACGDDDSSDFATRPSGDSSSACEDCDCSSSSKAKSSSSSSVTPQSSDSETSVSSSSVTITDGSEYDADNNTLTDLRDSTVYKTVTIGTQIWMAENLNYAYTGVPYKYTYIDSSYTSDSTSWCYGDSLANCTKYGRLYTWAAAMDSVGTWSTNGKGCGYGKRCTPTYPVRGVCPEGWHLPTKAEFETLFTAVGGSSTADEMLKSTSGWNSSGNGTDSYAFSVLPAGYRDSSGVFNNEGSRADFWSSSERSSITAYYMYLHFNYNFAYLFCDLKNFGFSVRCLKDLQAE